MLPLILLVASCIGLQAQAPVAPQPWLAIEGTVRLAEGEEGPLPAGIRAGLEPVEPAGAPPGKDAAVSDTGEFRLEGVQAGEYWPRASKLPGNYQVTEIRYNGSNVRGGSIVAGSAAGGAKLEFVIGSRLGSVRGSVCDAEDDCVSGAAVVLFPFPAGEKISPYEIRTCVSEMQGDFSFTAVPPGRYKAVVLLGPDAARYRDAALLRSKEPLYPVIEVHAAKVVNVTIKP